MPNVATGSVCAYDRIVMTDDGEEDYANNFGIDTVSGGEVSDHFPVWAEFHTDNDNLKSEMARLTDSKLNASRHYMTKG